MLKVLESEAAIAKCQRLFVRSLKSLATQTIPVRLGHPGANEKTKVHWAEPLGLWFHSRKVTGHFWNAFGLSRPETDGDATIACEINFPLTGIDRRFGGAFAADPGGQLLVVHRGKLGGGRVGVGKRLFEERYRGVWEEMDDGGQRTAIAVVGLLHSERLARQVAQFVRKVARLKGTAAPPSFQGELAFEELAVREELIGERYHDQEPETGARCDHGLVVSDLAAAVKARGFRAGNDGHRDLLVLDRRNRIGAVFQVLPDMTPGRLHAAATRLLLSGLSLPDNPRLILALPGPPDNTLRDKLRRLNIDLITYAWQGDRALFAGLAALLPPAAP